MNGGRNRDVRVDATLVLWVIAEVIYLHILKALRFVFVSDNATSME